MKRLFTLSLLFGVFLGAVSAQAYLPDLKNEDLNSLELRLKTMGTTYKAEPLLAAYLTVGRNPKFVARLIEKGCSPNLKAAGSNQSPLALAVAQDLSPEIVGLLLQAGAVLEARIAGSNGNIIDAALEKQEYQNANLLIKAHQRNPKARRLALSEPFKDYPAFFLDDLDQVRNLLRYGDFGNSLVWNLALAGNSRKVLRYLMDLQIGPHFNAPGSRYENTKGVELLASNVELLAALLSEGLSRDEVNFDVLYQKLFAAKNLDSVRALKALDTQVRPGLLRLALGAGLEFLQATTNNFAELTDAALFDAPTSGEPPLLFAIYEKTDFATIVPLLNAHPSEAGLLQFYRYAFAKKNLALLRALASFDARKVRPDLYAGALDAGIDALKALTHDLQDFKNPALYSDANQDNGREKLIALLWQTANNRRSLLESIYEKTDFATLLSIVEAIKPAPELLAGKLFSAAYQQWLNRANKDILTFGFPKLALQASVQGTEITLTVPALTDVSALVATFTLSGGRATVGAVVQVSGVTANDFSSPVPYLVVAQDGSKKTYTVTVTVTPPPPPPPPVEPPVEPEAAPKEAS